MKVKKLIGKKCYLSPINIEDYDQYYKWLNESETSIYLSVFHEIIARHQEKDLLDKLIRTDNGNYMMAIVDNETDTLLGNCGLLHVDKINRTAEFGIFIGDERFRGKGIGEEATRLILDFGFNAINLNHIWLRVFTFNKNAIALYHKIGFNDIGKKRESRIIGNNKVDELLMDILSGEFESPYILPLFERVQKRFD
jgi:RimJ/RimL family protein N-acetyltransferase